MSGTDPILGSQPAGDQSHNVNGRLPLLSAMPTFSCAEPIGHYQIILLNRGTCVCVCEWHNHGSWIASPVPWPHFSVEQQRNERQSLQVLDGSIFVMYETPVADITE